MKYRYKKLMFLIAMIVPLMAPSIFFSNRPINIEAREIIDIKQASSRIEIARLPSRSTFSLGDPIELEGIQIDVYDDSSEDATLIDTGFTISDGDSFTLGKQTLTINYDGQSTTLDIDITNEGALIAPLMASDPFISEIIIQDDGAVAIEIYLDTVNSIELSNYQLLIQYAETSLSIDLPELAIDDDVFVIDNGIDGEITAFANHSDAALSLIDAHSIALYDTVGQQSIDLIDLSDDQTLYATENGYIDIADFHASRSPKVTNPTLSETWSNWRVESSFSSLGSHALSLPRASVEQQAVSYAEYIMYGIGMNAANNYFNVFYELSDEYGFMHPDARAYLLANKDHDISGINESGNYVTNSFGDAIGRYNYLAAKTGNPGLTSTGGGISLNTELIGQIILFGGIIIVFGIGYFILKRKSFI